jgi:CubicO group peptidase (beta-lactamase class C family)
MAFLNRRRSIDALAFAGAIRHCALLAIFTGGLIACSASGVSPEDEPSLFERGGASRLEEIVKGSGGSAVPGIVVARVDANAKVDTLAAGCAQFDSAGKECKVPLTPDSVIRVASLSKWVAALGVMRLVANGQLSLDRDVSDYLGFELRNPAFPREPITLRSLMSHTSSVRDGETYWAVYPGTLADLMKSPQYFDAGHPPGQFFTYSNLNFGIVGTVIECAAHERFDLFMHRAVFGALQAGYNWSGLESLPPNRVATLYRKQDPNGVWNPEGPWLAQVDYFGDRSPVVTVRAASGFQPAPANYQPCTNGTLFAPQGGLRITARDLARLAGDALRNGVLDMLSEPVWKLDAAQSNGDSTNGLYRAYGTGSQLELLGSSTLVGHFGDAYGLKGGVLVDPVQKTVWVYLITGASREPELAPSPYSGLDTTEAAVLKAMGLP